MSCKVTTPAYPNGSTWGRPWESDVQKKYEDTIIESRKRLIKREDRIAERGRVSMSHHNMVHKPIPIPKAMKNIEARAALDKEWTTLQKVPAWDESKVTSKAEVIH